jgi:hypothetical protein
MSNAQIPNLPVAIALNGTEQLEAVQSGTSKQITTLQIGQYVATQYPAPGVTSVATSYPITGGTITTTGTISLADAGVTNVKLAPMPGQTVKGNPTVSSSAAQDITASQVLNMIGSTHGQILFRGASAWAALNPALPNNVFISRGTSSDPTYTTMTALLDATMGSDQGSILVRNATNWTILPPGLYKQVLVTNGPSANLAWETRAGLGTVTEINTGTGLTGGPITSTGTISIANTAVTAGSYGTASIVPSYTVNAQGQLTAAADIPIAISAAAVTSGVLAVARGGTGTGSTPTNGQLLIGNGTGYSVAALTQGTGLTITNGSGTVTLGITNTAVTAGSYGSSSSVGTFTVNAQGQLTAAASVPINAIALTTGTISTAPSNDTDIANKLYVDSVASGLNFHAACNYATTTSNVYTVSYNNGASGIGATLTNTGTLAAFSIDGVTMTSGNIGNRLLIKNQANAAYNGVYTLTTVGSGSVAWVLTRATDYDSSGSGTNEIDAGDFMYVLLGNTLANTSWVQQTQLPIVVGTTGLVFTQFGAQIAYTAGTGLTLSANQFSITNTTVTANSYGSASSVGTFTVNAQGQLTAASSTNIAIDAAAITSGTVASARISGSYTGITGVGTLTAGTWNATTIAVGYGGTGLTSYTVGDLLYASGTTTLAKLADVATGSVLVSGGIGVAPAYSATPTLTSLTAAAHYGGTGVSSTLTLQSTTGVGSTDSIVMKVGNNGAVTAQSIATTGIVSFPTTGAIVLPVGTTAQQPTGASGMLRFNSTSLSFEGYNGSVWGSIGGGGGATGGGADKVFWENDITVTTSYTITTGKNAGSFGPISINPGAIVTVPAGSVWSIV